MRALAFVLLAVVLPARAQMAPRPFAALSVQSRVVDAATGKPIPGAIVVARWNWLTYYPGGFHSSARHQDEGEVLHIAEAVTDAQGGFTIPGFGPTVRRKGSLQENAPSLTVFVAGYEPFQKDIGDDRSEVRLKRHSGPAAEYAAKIGAAQGDSQGLHWLLPNTDWKSMPRMVEALHREKVRLGDEGVQIRSAHRLTGLSGAGEIVHGRTSGGIQAEDKLPGEPYPRGAIWTAWTMRRVDGSPGTMRLTYSRTLEPSQQPSAVTISPWTVPGPDSAVPGWEAVKDAPPSVRVHAWGYRPAIERAWTGGIVALDRVTPARDAIVQNVRELRRDIDAELVGNRAQAIENHRPLLALLAAECRALTPDLRAGICFPDDSDVGVALKQRNVVGRFDRIPEDGPPYRLAGVPAPSRIQAQTVQAPGGSAVGIAAAPQSNAPRKRGGGFSIEPVK